MKKLLGTLVGVLMVLSMSPIAHAQTVQDFQTGTQRLSGTDRYATAVAVSQNFEPGVPIAYVATGTDFPDALAAAAAAAQSGGPLLLTSKGSVPKNVLNELKRLGPAEIVIAGGTGVVSKNVEQELRTIASVVRLGGDTRYNTGEQIVRHAFTHSETVFIATGHTFPDALAASGAAGYLSAPVILANGRNSTLPSSTLSLINDLGAQRIIIAGGAGAVSNGIATQLSKRGLLVDRIGGSDRYATATMINNNIFQGSEATVFLATGTNFPDALAGAALAGQVGAALYVTQPKCSPQVLHDHLNYVMPSSTVALGGKSTVSDASLYNELCVPAKPTKLTFAQQNAVKTAQSYLSFMHFSRSGLIDQLVFEKYSKNDATKAVDYISPDWYKQAAGVAANYFEFMSFSRDGLIDQLLFEGFTRSQAEYGVAAVGY